MARIQEEEEKNVSGIFVSPPLSLFPSLSPSLCLYILCWLHSNRYNVIRSPIDIVLSAHHIENVAPDRLG